MLQLKAKERTQPAGKARQDGRVPGILYGHGLDNVKIAFDYQDFVDVFEKAGESSLIDLDLDKKERKVLIHDFQLHPVSDKILHIDLYQVRMDETVTTEIPFNFVGQAPAVQEEGGVLARNMDSIEVEALPADLPSEIKIDLKQLKSLEDIVRVEDLDVGQKVELKEDSNQVVVSVVLPQEEEEEPEEVEEGVEEILEEGEETGEGEGEGEEGEEPPEAEGEPGHKKETPEKSPEKEG